MTRATEISNLLKTRLEAIPGVTVFRGRGSDRVPDDCPMPVILMRSRLDTLQESRTEKYKARRTLVVEMITDEEDPEPTLDTLLRAVRRAIGAADSRPLDGLALAITESGNGYNEAPVGAALSSLVLMLQVDYIEQ
jgi:hypothetical protein